MPSWKIVYYNSGSCHDNGGSGDNCGDEFDIFDLNDFSFHFSLITARVSQFSNYVPLFGLGCN